MGTGMISSLFVHRNRDWCITAVLQARTTLAYRSHAAAVMALQLEAGVNAPEDSLGRLIAQLCHNGLAMQRIVRRLHQRWRQTRDEGVATTVVRSLSLRSLGRGFRCWIEVQNAQMRRSVSCFVQRAEAEGG